MIRSMSSALSGLRNHQTMLDVVGNDIANVSTIGFKSSSTVFADVLSQTLSGAGAPGGQTGGTNPAQIGLGSRLVGTVQSFTQGAIQRTGRSTDVAIQGDGFFVVGNAGQNFYTRAGAFNLDAGGNLVTPDGMFVQGWQGDQAGVVNTNAQVGPVQIQVGELLPPVQTSGVDIGGNLPADAAVGAAIVMTLTGYDTQGNALPVTMTFTKTAVDQWTVTADDAAAPPAPVVGDGVLTFDAMGELLTPADHNMTIAGGQIAGFPDDITFNLGIAGQPGRLTQYAGDASAAIVQQNGSPAGSLESFDLAQDGTIVGKYSNGNTRAIGQLALAVFTNPGGLERIAGVWRETPNSGLAQIGTPGGGGRGQLSAGTLEMSNVDLAQEFTNLIVAQRGFQANSRVITASDELLQDLANLRR